MRTKHLLTAMVLPALFAACTNDDFQSAAPEAPVNAEGRNLVENVTLNLGAPETRLAYDGNYTWEADDQIGACLMDVITSNYNTPGAIWRNRFDLTDYIQTNYKFTYDGESAWTTEAKLLEGNYFFSYPYNANRGKRDAYTFSAATQTLESTSKEDLEKAYVGNNSFVGYGKVVQGVSEGEAIDVELLNVFGSTGITIENTGTQTYVIERVVLRGNKVYNAATVDPTDCTPSIQYDPSKVLAPAASNEFNVAQYTKDTDDLYNVTLNPTGEYVSNWSDYDRYDALRDVLDYKQAGNKDVELTIKGGNEIARNQSISVIVMLGPSEITTTNDAVLDIYTDKGIISGIDLSLWYTANDPSSTGTTNVLTDMALTEVGTGNKVKVTFDDTSLDVPATMDIDNDADLKSLIHWNANQANAIDITANLLNNSVTLTKDMYAEYASSHINSFKINGNNGAYRITIAKDVADGALNKINYETVSEVRVNGTQSLASNIKSKVRIQSGATVNVTKEVKLSKNIDNYGTLSVNAKVNVNSGTPAINNYATMVVASGKEIVKGVKVTNGDAVNFEYPGVITNAGAIRNLNNTEMGAVVNTGIIGTEAQVAQLVAEPSVNAGTIENNNGRVFLKENKTLYASAGFEANVYANGTSTTRINDNGNDADATKNGNIIITKLDANNGNFLTDNNKKGNLVQEITAPTNTDGVDGRANTIWLSSTLNVEKTDKDGKYLDVDLINGGTAGNAPTVMNGAINLVAKTANARIDGRAFQKFSMNSITINPKAKLVLNNINMYVATGSSVMMLGSNNNVATFTINSNAALTAADGTTSITVVHPNSSNAAHNVLDNNSNSTNITL